MRILAAALFPALLVGCAADSSPCSDAAARLTACSDEQREAFVAACEESGAADSSALVAEDSDAACKAVPSDGKADQGTATAMGLCVAAMYGVKWSITGLSPKPLPLSDSSKALLRPLYGSLVDEVSVSVGATLPPRIVIAGHELSVQPDAMTFGSQIFILQEVKDDTTSFHRLLLTTVHEMTHSKQSKAAGGYYGFAVSYCADMIAANFDYDHIHLEEAAYDVQDNARDSLQACGHVTCP